jgi:LysM repeat protein
MENKYHIDVTPEEDQLFRTLKTPQKIDNILNISLFKNKIFWVVLIIHVVILSLIGYAASPDKNQLTPETSSNIQHTEQDPLLSDKNVPIDGKPKETTPPHSPKQNISVADKNVPMDGKPKETTPQTVNPIADKRCNSLIKEYTIKKGDTIYSISKKYKLNTDKLLKINNIKDINKISIGQKLKFM